MSDLTRLREVRDMVSSTADQVRAEAQKRDQGARLHGLANVLTGASIKLSDLVSNAKRDRALGEELGDRRAYFAARAPERPNWFKVPVEGELPEPPDDTDLDRSQRALMQEWFQFGGEAKLSQSTLRHVLAGGHLPPGTVPSDAEKALAGDAGRLVRVCQAIRRAKEYREARVAHELAARMAAVAAWPWHWADTVLAAENPPAAE